MAYEGSQRLGELFKNRREKGEPGLPTLSVTLNNGLVDRASLGRKTDTNLADGEHLLVRKGDIVYNMMRMWQGASGVAEKDGLVSPAYVVLAPKAKIDSRYASYLFKSQRMIYLFWAYSYGLTSDRLRLYFRDFSRIPFDVPPLREQENVAEILAHWDRAMAVADACILNSQRIKNALVKRLLFDEARLPDFKTSTWASIRLGAFANIDMGVSPTSDAYNVTGTGLPLIQGNADVIHRRSNPKIFTSEVTKVAPVGSVLLSVRAPVGEVAISIHRACIGRGMAALNAKLESDNRFLYQLLLSHETRWANLSQGSTFTAINSSDIRKQMFRVPSDSVERSTIADVLDGQDRETALLERRRLLLAREQIALMQRLLPGKRRAKLDSAA